MTPDLDGEVIEMDSLPTPSRHSVRYERVRRVRSFEDVVEQIRASIVTGSLPIGERLPSERELAEMFGVSRPTLREALRALEAVGLLDIRLGAQGGAFAGSGDLEASASAFSAMFAAHAAARPDDLTDLRATQHADNAFWAEPDAVVLRELDAGRSTEATFLVALAEATGNHLRVLLATAIERAVGEMEWDVPRLGPAVRVDVLALVRAGDCALARDRTHLGLSSDSSRAAVNDASG